MLPHLVSATGVRSILACLGVLPSELAGGPGTKQAMPRGPQGHMQGSLGQSTALRCGLGQVLGKGAPSPMSLLHPYPRFLGLEEEDLDGIQIFLFPSQASGQDAGGR